MGINCQRKSGWPNGGSASQYFLGNFDGHTFSPFTTATKWVDYGPDEYAGVTWSNTGNRKIFLGWMSNWQYATIVPTEKWCSAMTVPRDLSIEKAGSQYWLCSNPVKELGILEEDKKSIENIEVQNYNLTEKSGKLSGPARLTITANMLQDFSCTLSNSLGEYVVIGYDKKNNHYFIDRTHSGKVDFEKGFAAKHIAPRLSDKNNLDLTMIIDNASVELFADNGLSVMTSIFFPNVPFSDITIQSPDRYKIRLLQYSKMKSIYEMSSMTSVSKSNSVTNSPKK